MLGFQSTHPIRDATYPINQGYDQQPDFNPRIPLGMRPEAKAISLTFGTDFNPRIPLGMRQKIRVAGIAGLVFQSTHPIRDATPKQHL